jgi:D-proline reductase (dithiol) PrdB
MERDTDSAPVDYVAQTRETYRRLGYPDYRWAESGEPTPWTPLARPVAESRLLLIGSGGVYRHGQVAFHHRDDTSFREIASDVPLDALRTSHFAYDQSAARRDPNVVFPIGTLRALVAEGALGGLAASALSFMGGIYSQRRLHEELLPRLLARVHALQADLALLVPV